VVDVGVWVLLKMVSERSLELGDLAVQLGDDPDSGFGRGATPPKRRRTAGSAPGRCQYRADFRTVTARGRQHF
jgi:hypothetical protein